MAKRQIDVFGVLHSDKYFGDVIGVIEGQNRKYARVAIEVYPEKFREFEAWYAEGRKEAGISKEHPQAALLSVNHPQYKVDNFWYKVFKHFKDKGAGVFCFADKDVAIRADKEAVAGFFTSGKVSIVEAEEKFIGKIKKIRPELLLCGSSHPRGILKAMRGLPNTFVKEIVPKDPKLRVLFSERESARRARQEALKQRLLEKVHAEGREGKLREVLHYHVGSHDLTVETVVHDPRHPDKRHTKVYEGNVPRGGRGKLHEESIHVPDIGREISGHIKHDTREAAELFHCRLLQHLIQNKPSRGKKSVQRPRPKRLHVR